MALCLLAATIGCKSQSAQQNDATLNRRIEVVIRSQFHIPSDVALQLQPRHPGNIPGYQIQPVLLTRSGHSTQIEFLISDDNKKLARLDSFDLENSPVFHINVENRPMRGNPNAPVTVITFDDLECPYCSRMHKQLFPETMDHYKSLVRFIYKDFPLDSIHPWAVHAAVDANCLAAQNSDAYWKFVDYVHDHPEEMSSEDHNLHSSFTALDRIAGQMGTLAKLDETSLNACIKKQDDTAVRKSMAEADALGLEGAPALYVNGEMINGAVPIDQVWQVIDRALKDAGLQPPPNPAAAQLKSAPAEPAAAK